ncbi:hypothetical protein ACRW9N_11480 [Listeria aquatica]|uniref:hypothetical protein n=1 Tax=Listeria aquatica TaxID=1494960 RepID=UPI003EF7DC62
MKALIKVQFYYFRQLVQKRFLYLMMVIILTEIILAIQLKDNPQTSMFSLFFYGTSFHDVASNRVQIPVLWFCFFTIPLFIIGNSLQALWEKYSVQLRGNGFSQFQFGIINTFFLYLIAFAYTSIAFAIASFCQKLITGTHTWLQISETHHPFLFFAILLGSVLVLLFIQQICALFSPIAGIVIPIIILIVSIYTSVKWNLLNLAMLARFSYYSNFDCFYIYITLIILSAGYLIVYKKRVYKEAVS